MTTRLNEYNKIEWLDVARKLVPNLTEEKYEEMWTKFVKAKEDHEKQKNLN